MTVILHPIHEPDTMKKKVFWLFLIFDFIWMMYGCEKVEIKTPRLNCCPEVFSVPNRYADSIYYSENKVSRIDKYYLAYIDRDTRSRFEYGDNKILIFVRDFYWGSWRDVIYYSLSFENGKIAEVATNGGRVQANYCYDGSRLKYILYHKDGLDSDSISVTYYSDGANIRSASWFKFNREIGGYEETSNVVFTYDNKNNPYKNSIHFLYNFYDGEEFSLDYFNANNLKTVKSVDFDQHPGYIYNYNLHAEYTYNENGYPVSVIFYNELNQITDRNIITYNCN